MQAERADEWYASYLDLQPDVHSALGLPPVPTSAATAKPVSSGSPAPDSAAASATTPSASAAPSATADKDSKNADSKGSAPLRVLVLGCGNSSKGKQRDKRNIYMSMQVLVN